MVVKKKRKNRIKPNLTKRQPFKWRSWHFFLLAGIVILSYLFLFGNHGFIRFYLLQRRKRQLTYQIEQLKQEQVNLQQEIDQLQKNYLYIEKIAREKYQMGKPGEKIYFMVSPDKEKKNQ